MLVNRGILEKSLREAWPATLLAGIGLAAVEALLSYIIPTFFAESAGQWLKMPFIQQMLKGLLGSDVAASLGPATMVLIPWTHPLVLSLVWAHEIALCTRTPAGEIDRGTIDLVLCLPVSRGQLFICETLVWMVCGLIVVLMGVSGNVLGSQAMAAETRATTRQLIVLAINLFCLYLAVGGVVWFISACSDRRGRAVAYSFAFVLISFLLNFLAQFSDLAKRLSVLSVMHYYRPLFVVRDSALPVFDLTVLLGIGVVGWAAGLIVFRRRDIRTL